MHKMGLVLDSNYFLHYHLPEAINWAAVIGREIQLVLLVIPPVTSEIDKKKWAGKSESERQRAKDVTSTFKQWFHKSQLPDLPGNVSIEKVKLLPSISSDLTKSPDDQILEYALDLRASYSDFAILTHDFGLQDRARDLGLSYLELPDNFQRKLEVDPVKKELIAAKKELNTLKNRVPKIQVSFDKADHALEFKVDAHIGFTAEQIENEVEKIKIKHPLSVYKKNKEDVGVSINGKSLYEIDKEKWDRYNSNLQEYYTEYRSYLTKLDTHEELLSRTIIIELNVENQGAAPASDLYIKLHFPLAKDFTIFDEEIFPSRPEAPTPPKKPESSNYLLGFGKPWAPPLDLSRFVPNTAEPPNVSALYFKDYDNGMEVTFEIRSLKHYSTENIEKIFLVLPRNESRSFQISWEALADEMPSHDKGSLPVLIR